MKHIITVCILALFTIGCGGGSGTTTDTPTTAAFSMSDLNDQWNFESDNEGTFTLMTIDGSGVITASDNGDFISGSFSIDGTGNVTGTETNADGTFAYTGTMQADKSRMSGTWSGAGFNGTWIATRGATPPTIFAQSDLTGLWDIETDNSGNLMRIEINGTGTIIWSNNGDFISGSKTITREGEVTGVEVNADGTWNQVGTMANDKQTMSGTWTGQGFSGTWVGTRVPGGAG